MISNHAFISDVVLKIPGRFNGFTAGCAMDLLDKQSEDEIAGSSLEIGVQGGRFSSILARDAVRRQSHLVVLDGFRKVSLPRIRETLAIAADMENMGVSSLRAGSATVDLIAGHSGDWTAPMLAAQLGAPARFVHIDGSQLREDALWSLDLADRVLAPAGVIAVDGWLNPQCVGVMEATVQFYARSPRASVPFAFVCGKLFLCGRRHAAGYAARLKSFAHEDQRYPTSEKFRAWVKNNVSCVHQNLCGFPILVVTA